MTYLYGKEGISGIQCYCQLPQLLVAHWNDRKDGEQAGGECEGREREIGYGLGQRDEVCTQTHHDDGERDGRRWGEGFNKNQ
jgi:hypothetical protein